MKRLYFGHPINVYDTPLEWHLIGAIVLSTEFVGWDVENPNQMKHNAGYQRGGMIYYFEEVLPICQGGVFLPFRDGKWGQGVYGELKWFFDHGRPIWRISHEGWVERLAKLPPPEDILSVEETRSRIRTPDKKTVPY